MTKRMWQTRAFALASILTLVLVACGQKSGVHAEGLVGGDTGGLGAGATGGVGGTGGTAGVGGTAGTAGSGTTGGVGGAGGVGGTSGSGTTGGTGVVGGTTIGVTKTEIVIGVHAPITGAAPIEPKAFAIGKDLYWRWLHEMKGKTVYGRKVKVVFRNDEYTPTTAVAVCNEMASRERAFLLIGAAGTDQINACAGFADPRGIPYLSPGVQEAGLQFRRTYFPVTMTYKQQMPLLIDMLKDRIRRGQNLNKYGGASSKVKIGHVRPNTPNFNDAAEALKQASLAAGFDYKTYTVVKEGRADEAKTVAANLEADNVDVVIPITPPVFTIGLVLGTASSESYAPLYAGVGITNNVNQMIAQACRSDTPQNRRFDGAIFFSPWPGWRETMSSDTTLDPDFRKAADKYAPTLNKRDKGGDILLALWGIMKTLHRMLEAAGPNLSREGFIATLNNGFRSSLKVFPDIRYSATNHFGGRNVHVLRGDCFATGETGEGPQYVSHPDYNGLQDSF